MFDVDSTFLTVGVAVAWLASDAGVPGSVAFISVSSTGAGAAALLTVSALAVVAPAYIVAPNATLANPIGNFFNVKRVTLADSLALLLDLLLFETMKFRPSLFGGNFSIF